MWTFRSSSKNDDIVTLKKTLLSRRLNCPCVSDNCSCYTSMAVTYILSHFWRPGSPREKFQEFGCLVRDFSWLSHGNPPSCEYDHLLLSLFTKAVIPSMRLHSHGPATPHPKYHHVVYWSFNTWSFNTWILKGHRL